MTIVLTFCLMAHPATCWHAHYPAKTASFCLMEGEEKAARTQLLHPEWRLARVACATAPRRGA